MYSIAGFMARSSLANNQPRAVAPVGELSVYSATFARDRLIFGNQDHPGVSLFVFESVRELSSTETEKANVPASVEATGREISVRLYALADGGHFTNVTRQVEDVLLNEYGGRIKNVTVGPMVNDGNRWMPSYIIYEGASSTNPYRARWWYSDAAFRLQFEGYEINVVPPFKDIDQLFSDLATVDNMIKVEQSQVAVNDKIREIQDLDPYTDVKAAEYEWIQPGNTAVRRMITITVIIYGEAGMNPDRRRKAIADWILKNSKYDEDAWRQIMPEIFSPTEFIFAPAWNRYSKPSGTVTDWATGEYPEGVLSAGAYMPGGNVKNQVEFLKTFAKGTGYTDQHLAEKTNLVSFVYKSIQCAIIGGHMNRDNVDQFLDRWPDYMAVGMGTVDFDRMDESTQKMAILMNDLFRVAETMTASSSIPRAYAKVPRDGILFLQAEFERTQLLVVCRESVKEHYQYSTGSANVPV